MAPIMCLSGDLDLSRVGCKQGELMVGKDLVVEERKGMMVMVMVMVMVRSASDGLKVENSPNGCRAT